MPMPDTVPPCYRPSGSLFGLDRVGPLRRSAHYALEHHPTGTVASPRTELERRLRDAIRTKRQARQRQSRDFAMHP